MPAVLTISREMLQDEIQSRYGYTPLEAARLVRAMETANLIELHNVGLSIPDPTTPDSACAQALAYSALGRDSGVPRYKVKEFLDVLSRRAIAQGASNVI